MENNLFQQAKNAIKGLTNMQENANDSDKQAAKNAIEAAHKSASPEEQEQLKQLEQQLKETDQLS